MNARLARPVPSPGADADGHEGSILVVESSPQLGRELVEQLRADGYRATHARTAEHARALARSRPARLVVLGALDSPRGALDLLAEIRRCTPSSSDWEEHLPAIVLSPGAGQLDLLRAFEAGADDFIAGAGPYLELRARLKAVLRRVERSGETRLLQVGPLLIDTGAHVARVAGKPVELCRLEYELLVHLAREPARVFSKQELLSAIWGQRSRSGERTVDSHSSRLRRKLDAAGAPGLVVNVWGVGYRLT